MDDFRFEDLRVQIDPQSGADSIVSVVDTEAALTDVAVIVDKGGNIPSAAGRPQPPPAGGFATFGIAITCTCSV